MEIFKKVTEGAKSGAKSVAEGAKTIGRKSSDLVESAKLKYEIAKLEKELENNISALGNLVFMQFKGDKGLEEEVDRLLKSTKELEDDIVKFEDQFSKLNPKAPVCPKCQIEMPMTSKFCYNCGGKISHDENLES